MIHRQSRRTAPCTYYIHTERLPQSSCVPIDITLVLVLIAAAVPKTRAFAQ